MTAATKGFPPAPDKGFRPGWFLGGFLVGIAALALIGWRVGNTDYLTGYVRMIPPITPETQYYPSVDQMCAIVRAKCRKDQVLVIVGGNSILEGVWQPAADLWSKKLQEDLGPGYAVVNLAFRGSAPTDGGAVIAEVLRDEFPRQVYVADEAPMNGENSFGTDAYRYIFWEAYFDGRLMPFPIRDFRIREFLADDRRHRDDYRETAIREYSDRLLRFHDLWNFVGYEYFFTVPSLYAATIPGLLKPRREFPDTEVDVSDPRYASAWYPASTEAVEMKIVRSMTSLEYEKGADGRWRMHSYTLAELRRTLKEAFPDPLKGRTLMLVSRSSPYYVDQLSPEERALYDQATHETVALWREQGYPCFDYGSDFSPQDYGDRTHLSKYGGAKLARMVADEVRVIAAQRGYLK